MTSLQKREDPQSNLLSELSTLVLNIIRSDKVVASTLDEVVGRGRRRGEQISPAGIASLLLGISFALMLGGSLTFFIGFLLMPWVVGFGIVCYVVGVVSSLSMLGRAVLCCRCSNSPPQKDCSSWKLL